jgi:hypothetical protein
VTAKGKRARNIEEGGMLGPLNKLTGSVLSLVGHTVLDVTSIPPLDVLPGRRAVLGAAVFLDANGSDILDFLGDDLDERADTLQRIFDGCDEDELGELLEAVQEAFVRRARRQQQIVASANDNGGGEVHRSHSIL